MPILPIEVVNVAIHVLYGLTLPVSDILPSLYWSEPGKAVGVTLFQLLQGLDRAEQLPLGTALDRCLAGAVRPISAFGFGFSCERASSLSTNVALCDPRKWLRSEPVLKALGVRLCLCIIDQCNSLRIANTVFPSIDEHRFSHSREKPQRRHVFACEEAASRACAGISLIVL